MAYIELKEVDKIYPMGEIKLKALDKATFEIEKGELVVILGQSGSGKSTCLNIIGGMDTATNVDVSASLNTDYVIETGNGYLKVNGNNYNCSPSTSISQKPITLYGIVGSSKLKGRFKTYY